MNAWCCRDAGRVTCRSRKSDCTPVYAPAETEIFSLARRTVINHWSSGVYGITCINETRPTGRNALLITASTRQVCSCVELIIGQCHSTKYIICTILVSLGSNFTSVKSNRWRRMPEGLFSCVTDRNIFTVDRLCQTDYVNQGPDYKKILRLSYDVIKTYDNRKSNLR